MIVFKLILISRCILFIWSCNPADMKSKQIVENVHLQETKDDVEPPPYDLKPTFKTIEDWLFSICNSEEPEKYISQYSIGLFESKDNYVLFLVGLNRTGNHEEVDFKPSNMYFLISKDGIKNFEREQFIEKVTKQLIYFTKSKKFEKSFLAKSSSIVFDGSTVIWSK
jgi:hypothetical protein